MCSYPSPLVLDFFRIPAEGPAPAETFLRSFAKNSGSLLVPFRFDELALKLGEFIDAKLFDESGFFGDHLMIGAGGQLSPSGCVVYRRGPVLFAGVPRDKFMGVVHHLFNLP